MIDLAAVHAAMMMLEDRTKDPEDDVPVGVVAARILGIEHSEEFDEMLTTETRRVLTLMRGHYAREGVRPSEGAAAALGFVQGITFAAAVEKVKSDG